METEKKSEISEGDISMQQFNLELRKFFMKYDGFIKLFFLVAVVFTCAFATYYLWESHQVIYAFRQDPIGYCREIAFNFINP